VDKDSWDEALDTIEQRLKEIRDKYGAESVLFCQGREGMSVAPSPFWPMRTEARTGSSLDLQPSPAIRPGLRPCLPHMGIMRSWTRGSSMRNATIIPNGKRRSVSSCGPTILFLPARMRFTATGSWNA